MCIYSLHVDKSQVTRAVKGKNLTLRTMYGHNCFVTDEGKVACIKKGSTINLTVQSDMIYKDHPLSKWMGKTVQATMKVSVGRYAADTLIMPDGQAMAVAWLKLGTTARIPKKVRSDAGVPRPHRRKRNLDKILNLDQIRAEVPHATTEPVSG